MDSTWKAVEPVEPHNPDGRIERIIDYFFDPEVREEFIRLFKELEQAYEILSPDPFLRPYIDDYALLAQIYQVVYEEYNPKAEQARIRRDLLRKTDALIRQHVHVDSLTDDLPQYQINRDIANVVRSDDVSDRVKVANLHRSLVIHVEQNKDQQPYLISLGERVETVIQQLHDRHIGVQTALDRLTNLAREGAEAQEEQQQSDLPGEAFAYKFVLQAQGVPEPEAAAREVHRILREHADWPYNSRLEQRARRSLYKYLWENQQRLIAERRAEYSAQSVASTLKETVDNLLRMHRTVTQQ